MQENHAPYIEQCAKTARRTDDETNDAVRGRVLRVKFWRERQRASVKRMKLGD